MAEVASAYVSVLPSARGFGRKLDSQVSPQMAASGKSSGIGWAKAFGAAALVAVGAAAVKTVQFLSDSVSIASEAQQSLGATESVFKGYADTVISASKRAAQEVGLSANEYRESANLIGSLFKNQGVATDELADKTDNMVERAADLSAMFGGTTKEAVEALGSAFKGEFNPLERYGISLRQSTINTEAYRLANVKSKAAFDKLSVSAQNAAKQQATTNLIMKQSKDSAGTFADEANTLAGQQQRLSAQWENMKIAVGTKLLPVLTDLARWFNAEGLPALTRFGTRIQELGDKYGPAFDRLAGYVQWYARVLFQGDQATDKFGRTLMQVRGEVAAMQQSFRQNFTAIRQIVTSAGQIISMLWKRYGDIWLRTVRSSLGGIRNIVTGVLQVIAGILRTIAAVMRGDWSKAWAGLKSIASGGVKAITGLFKVLHGQVTGIFQILGRTLVSMMRGSWSGVTSAVRTGANNAAGAVRELPSRIIGVFTGLAGAMYDIGGQVITGLANGIRNAASSAISAAADVASSAISAAKNKLGIRSPSRVFQTIGEQTGQGYVDGLRRQQREALRATTDLLATPSGPALAPRFTPRQIDGRGRNGGRDVVDLSGARFVLEVPGFGQLMTRVVRSEQAADRDFDRMMSRG